MSNGEAATIKQQFPYGGQRKLTRLKALGSIERVAEVDMSSTNPLVFRKPKDVNERT